MDTNTRPLAVVSVIGYCDSHLEHEHRLVTTGERAYVYTPSGVDAEAVHRDGDTLSVACLGQDPRNGEMCHGRVEWAMSEQVWTADTADRDLLHRYGSAVER